jgi:sugar phosphate isomerase/epimerase
MTERYEPPSLRDELTQIYENAKNGKADFIDAIEEISDPNRLRDPGDDDVSANERIDEIANDWWEKEQANGSTPPPPPTINALSEDIEEFLASCGKGVAWLVKPYVFAGGFTLLQGAPKSGKTWLAAWIAVCAAEQGVKTLVVEEEGTRDILGQRLSPFIKDARKLAPYLRVVFRKRIRLDQKESVDDIIQEIKKHGSKILVLDPLIHLHSKKEKESDEMMIVLSWIQQIITETGVAVLLLHHTRKGDSWDKSSNAEATSADARGSGATVGDVDHIIAVKGLPKNKQREGFVTFHVENPDTRVDAAFGKRTLTLELATGLMSEVDEAQKDPAELIESILDRLLVVLPVEPQCLSQSKAREALRVNKSRLAEAVQEGLGRGLIVSQANKGLSRPNTQADRGPAMSPVPPVLPVRLKGLGRTEGGPVEDPPVRPVRPTLLTQKQLGPPDNGEEGEGDPWR